MYCSKDGDFTEWGVLPADASAQGPVEADRWQSAWENAKLGNIEEIPADIRFRSYVTIKRIAADYMVRPVDLPGVCGVWYWGAAGTGKTTLARTSNPDAYIKSRDKWWDGYQGEAVVILDDLDKYNVCLGGYLKDWADKWTFKAEVKGGYRWLRPSMFIVTSQYPIDSIFEDTETREALHRRFTVTQFKKLV